jgi:methylase of polypeptide subunit release factors
MPARSPFTTVRSEGGLLPVDLLNRLTQTPESLPGTSPDDYHVPKGWRLRDAINRSFTELQGVWTAFQSEFAQLGLGERATTLTRERWLLPLFAELGYGRLARSSALSVEGRDYPISHIWGPVPIHLLGADIELDRRTKGVAGAAGASPHSMVQDLLNRSNAHLWAILSNGQTLRLLRDNTSLTRAAYVEFDIGDMFAGQVFADFSLLWMLCHQSRFEAERPDGCWEETWVSESKRQGVRALDHLRAGFEAAITALGAGFLAHPANTALKDRLRAGELTGDDYHRQILRLVYRLVFLLVGEDRDLLHRPEATDAARDVYARYYSLSRLRDRARRHRGTSHSDLWESLKPLFIAFDRQGLPAAGIPALGSFLWSRDACPDLHTAHLTNRDLLSAVRNLAYTERDRALHRVDFANLGPEELGSVYESLLELHPRIDAAAAGFELVGAGGSERKTTGSYYTPTPLIAALLDEALEPLLDEAQTKPDPQTAILSIKVLDPACGSGHFLTAAARRIAARLASIETGELNPPPRAIRHALRQVVGHCVYGIDVNPMAAELAKVNLWLDAVEPGLPLNFLDHHIVCGNGLVGATPRLLANGIPDEAFKAVEGDDKPTTAARKRANATQRRQRSQGILALGDSALATAEYLAEAVRAIDALDDKTIDGIQRKQERFKDFQAARDTKLAKLVADTWCAAFFAPKVPDSPAITDQTLRSVAQDRTDNPAVIALVASLADHYRFLHPHIAFPDVFTADPEAQDGWQGGFDLVLGNPPWDTLSPDRKEFFSAYVPNIRFVPKAEQDAIVAELVANPEVADRWAHYQRDLVTLAHFRGASGRYRIAHSNLGGGATNVYRMFVEVAMQLARSGGIVAQVVPGSFCGGAKEVNIRKELFERWVLTHVFGFVNTTGAWFPEVHRDTSFCLYVGRKGGQTDAVEVAFDIRSSADLARVLTGATTRLSVSDIYEQSPDALAIPEVTDPVDAALAARMSVRWPLLGDESVGPPIRHFQAELHLGNDRELFGDFAEGLPVYEGRMVDQFDHRAKVYRSGRGRSALWEEVPFGDRQKAVASQWKLPPDRIPSKLDDRVWRYRVGWCDVTGSRNERSLIAALIPPGVICGDSVPTLNFPDGFEWAYMPWLAVANSFCLDYLTRKRISLHIKFMVLDSLPFPRLPVGNPVIGRLAELALRLTCTGPEMTEYWNAMVGYGWCDPVPEGMTPPGIVDLALRADARAEIDAVVARELFELSADELAVILDTFPVLRRREEKAYGEYRTKRLVLEWYDKVSRA